MKILLIERKTKADFLASMDDGRLFRQLILMKRLYRRRMLLVEGSGKTHCFSQASLEGATTKINAAMQIPILYSKDGVMTARLIRRAALQLYGFTSASASRNIGSKSTASFHQINILLGIPEVGLHKAKALINHFGSLSQVFSASESEIREEPGIGAYLAGKLVLLFRSGV